MLKMFTEAIFVLPACINIEYLWFMLGAGFIFFSPLSLTPVGFFCILYYFLFVQSFSCLCTQWLECAFTDSSKLCTVWPWAHGSVDGGFPPPLWHQVTCPPPQSPKSLSAMALQFMCFLCVPWELLYFPEAPSPQSNKIWNKSLQFIFRSLWNSLVWFLHCLCKWFCSYCV